MMPMSKAGKAQILTLAIFLLIIIVFILGVNYWIKKEIQETQQIRMKGVATIRNNDKIDKNSYSYTYQRTTQGSLEAKGKPSPKSQETMVSKPEIIYEQPHKDVILVQ